MKVLNTWIKMADFRCLFLFIVANSFLSVAGTYCYYYTYLYGYTTYYCYYYSSYTSVGSIIGAVVGGIVGLIVLCVVSVIICVVCCKKKPTPGTVIHPAGVTTVTSASNNTYYNYPQHQQGWGFQPSAPYPGQQQPYPPPPPPVSQPPHVSQPMPPPAYAENVISGQPPQHTN